MSSQTLQKTFSFQDKPQPQRKFVNTKFLPPFFWRGGGGILACVDLDPDSQPVPGSADPFESGSSHCVGFT